MSNPETNEGNSSPPTREPFRLMGSRYPEVTWSAVLFAILIGIVMNAAITYSGLKIGFTITGSAIAAVLGFGVLRGLLRRGTILETNVAQTVASAINIANSGIIFTVPVLILLNAVDFSIESRDFWLITMACVAGAILGTAFIIPLRKQMLDIDRLRFPSPTGVAAILKSPGAGSAKAVVLVIGMLLGAAIYLPTALPSLSRGDDPDTPNVDETIDFDGYGYSALNWTLPAEPDVTRPPIVVDGEERPALTLRVDRDDDGKPDAILTDGTIDFGRWAGFPDSMQLIFAIAPFALGAGFITGRAGLFVLAGGILAFFVLNPLAYSFGWMPGTVQAHEAPGFGFGTFNRPLGIGLLLGGAFMGIVGSLPAIREALKSIGSAGRAAGGSDELGFKTLFVTVFLGLGALFLAALVIGDRPINTDCPVEKAPIVDSIDSSSYQGYTIGFASESAKGVWEGWNDGQRDDYLATLDAKPGWLASLSPAMRALIIALVGAAWMWFAGIIIAQCAGMTDWSPISGMALLTVVLVMLLAGTGAVVGSVLVGAALCVAITLASDMMGDLKTGYLVGSMPKRQQITEMIVVGIGPLVSMLTLLLLVQAAPEGQPAMGPGSELSAPQAQALQAIITGMQGGEMPYSLYGLGAAIGVALGVAAFSGLGVLVGLSMYLPFQYIATYGIGCVASIVIGRIKGRSWAEEWGVPFAAGLIVGESLLAIVINGAKLVI